MVKNLNDEMSKMRREKGAVSILFFAMTYFGHYFLLKPASFHLELYELLLLATRARGERIAIAAPRSTSKSVIVSLIYVIWCICYQKEQYIVLLSDTREQAIALLAHVKNELENNILILKDFPEISEAGGAPKPPRWNQAEIVTRNGVMVSALGAGQKLRGRRNKQDRPSLIIADDIENDTNTQNPDTRAKLMDWFTKAILKAGNGNTNVIVVGTIQHYDSLLAKLLDPEGMPGWTRRLYRSIISWSERPELWQQWSGILYGKEAYKSCKGKEAAVVFYNDNKEAMLKGTQVLWPEKESYFDLMLMREQEGSWSFDSEKQNDPVSRDKMRFNPEEFKYWSDQYRSLEELLVDCGSNLEFFGACDLSLGCKDGDYSAIIILGKDKRTGALYILIADIQRREPDQIIETILMYGRRFKYMKFIVETNQFQAVLYDQLRKRNDSEGVYLRLEETKNTANKEVRLSSLQPLIKSGTVQFDRRFRELIEECRYFPKGRHDDGLDALEMALRVCQTGTTPWAWFAGSGGVNLFDSRAADKINPATGLPDPRMNIYPLPDGRVPRGWWEFNS
jgi:predicted phage terminase large subunit-like protein